MQTTFQTPVDGATSWKQATFTPWYPTATSTNYQGFVMTELEGATEIVAFIGSSTGTTLTPIKLYVLGGRDIVSIEYDTKLLSVSNDTYNFSVSLRYTKSTHTLEYRQSYMGTSSYYAGIIEVWYR